MIKINIYKCIYISNILIVFSIPFTYALKDIFPMISGITWIDPAYCIMLLTLPYLLIDKLFRKVFIFSGISKVSYLFIVFTFISSIIAKLTVDTSVYNVFREPIKLSLFVILLLFIYSGFIRLGPKHAKKSIDYIVKFLVIIALVEVVISLISSLLIILKIPFIYEIPLLKYWFLYVKEFIERQSFWLAQGIQVPRIGGTFIESPVLGLFLVSIYFLTYYSCIKNYFWVRIIIAIGIVFTFSTQIYIGFFVAYILINSSHLSSLFRFKTIKKHIFVSVFLLILFLVLNLTPKLVTETIKMHTNENEKHGSIVERKNHLINSLSFFSRSATTIIFGIGPGRYGDYLNINDPFWPSTTTIQIFPVEILSETGIVGLIICTTWVVIIFKNSSRLGKYYCISLFFLIFAQSGFKQTIIPLTFAILCYEKYCLKYTM